MNGDSVLSPLIHNSWAVLFHRRTTWLTSILFIFRTLTLSMKLLFHDNAIFLWFQKGLLENNKLLNLSAEDNLLEIEEFQYFVFHFCESSSFFITLFSKLANYVCRKVWNFSRIFHVSL